MDRDRAYEYSREKQKDGEVVTGLLHISTDSRDMQEQLEIINKPLTNLPYDMLCPGSAELEKLQARFR